MKLLHMILCGSAALIAVINGCADAVDANTVSAASDLQERMLNEQNNEPNGIGIGITSPQHESKSGKSKSAKNGSNNVNVIDTVVAFAFGTLGFLGLANKINEEESIDILTRIIRKANDLERVIGTIDEGGGMRRLQTFGTNDNLFLAYVQVSVLKLQGLDDEDILDQLTMMFTERVASIIAGVLDPTVATTTTSTTPGCPALPTGTGTRGSGTAGYGQGCSQGDYCFDYAGGIGCPGSTYCRKSGEGSCYCFVEQSTGNPVDGCCVVDVDCTSRNCDTDVNPSPTGANNRCAPASSPSK